MPYTPAHTICAAPLWYLSRKRLPLPPLIIGCMAPDGPYFFHLAPIYAPGHTALGLITHALPHGLIALSLWYLWLESPLLDLFSLPRPKRQVSIVWGVLVALSLLLGAATHNLLDAASHEPGFFVKQFAWLSYPIASLPIFKWIQYGGGVLGLASIIWWYWATPKTISVDRPKSRLFWTGAILLSLSILVLMVVANWVHQSQDLPSLAVNSAAGAMSGFVVGACLYATLVHIKSVVGRLV